MSGIGPRGKVAIFVAPRGIHLTPLAPSVTAQTKKGLARGLPVHRHRSASAIRYAKSPARVSLGNRSERDESKQQHRDSERAPLRDAHCSLVSLRYVSQRATARPASRYISTRPAIPLYPHAPISPAYIPASSTVTQHASASAIRSAHPPRLRVTRRPNPLALPNPHISAPTTPAHDSPENSGSRMSTYNSAFMYLVFSDKRLHTLSITEDAAYDRAHWAAISGYPNDRQIDVVAAWEIPKYLWRLIRK